MSAGDGIRCPVCSEETSVLETRQNRGSLRRARRCLREGCPGRVTTVEMVAPKFSKKATTTDLVAVPTSQAAELEVVPRRLMQALRELLVADVHIAAPEEHW